jgi:hypothetical protein
MSKLHAMTFSKLGDPSLTLSGGGIAGIAGSAGAGNTTYEGDKIDIHGADQKSAVAISKEIMFTKRVRVRSNR